MEARHIDINFFTSFYQGNERFKQKMIAMFLEKAPVFLNDMQRYLDEGQLKELAASAHKFKSCIDFVGASGLRNAVDAIEKNAGSDAPESLRARVSDIAALCDEVVSELQTELSVPDSG